MRAADEADRRGGPAEVLLHAERALSLWPAVPDAESVTGVSEINVTRWAAWAAAATGDPDRGVALARRAVELADREPDPLQAADLRTRYATRLLELGEGEEPRQVVAEALALFEGAAPSGDLAWAHAVAARAAARLDDVTDAGREAYLALQVARTVVEQGLDGYDDALAAQADALVTLSVCEEALGRDEAARTRLAEAKELAHKAGNLGVELRTFFNTGISLLDAGRLDAAVAEFAAGEERAVATGTTWSGYGLELRVAHVLAAHMRGDWDDAESSARIGAAAVSETVATRVAAAALLTDVGRGRLDEAERRIAVLTAARPTDDQVLLLLGQAGAESALWRGDPGLALQRIAAAREGLLAWDPHHLAGIMLCAIGVAAHADLAETGRVPRAQAVAAAEELAAQGRTTAEKGIPRGPTWVSRGSRGCPGWRPSSPGPAATPTRRGCGPTSSPPSATATPTARRWPAAAARRRCCTRQRRCCTRQRRWCATQTPPDPPPAGPGPGPRPGRDQGRDQGETRARPPPSCAAPSRRRSSSVPAHSPKPSATWPGGRVSRSTTRSARGPAAPSSRPASARCSGSSPVG
ncbi:hypothetical protein ACFQV8_06660 [Pseudonocardia benzenivorans]